MGDIKTAADAAFRDYETEGVPSSGEHEPEKDAIRAAFGIIDTKVENIVAGNGQGLRTFATTSARNAFVHSAGTTGVTAQDLEDGNDYYSNGSAWVLIGPSVAARITAAEADIDVLDGRLDTAETDIAALETADTALDGRLDTAEAGIVTLTTNLATEVTARTNADTTLTTNLATEVTNRTNADTTLTTNLATEVTNRTNADAALDTRVVALEETVGDEPTGIYAGSLVLRNAGGWVTGILATAAEATSASSEFLTAWPTGGHFLEINEGGWVIKDYDDQFDDDETQTETEERVAAIHGDEVETAPLLVGKNILMSWGESKAIPAANIKTYFDELYADEVGAYPAGVSTQSAIYNLGGQTMADMLTPTQKALLRVQEDAAITAGGEAFSAWALTELANDILQRTTPDAWEANVRTALDLIRRDSLQRYVGTDPNALVPEPPVIVMAECGAWSANNLAPDLTLRAIALSHEIYRLVISFPEYIWQFSVDQLHGTTHDGHISAAYTALAMFYWRVLGKKYHPTQVRETWFDGGDAYLRCIMPKAPLVIGTELVSTITNEGLDAYDAAGAAITITGVSIVGGGRIIKVEQAGNWASGNVIRGALFGTTPNTSGRVTGPRSTIHDSSTETVTILGTPFRLYSPLLPFRITL